MNFKGNPALSYPVPKIPDFLSNFLVTHFRKFLSFFLLCGTLAKLALVWQCRADN